MGGFFVKYKVAVIALGIGLVFVAGMGMGSLARSNPDSSLLASIAEPFATLGRVAKETFYPKSTQEEIALRETEPVGQTNSAPTFSAQPQNRSCDTEAGDIVKNHSVIFSEIAWMGTRTSARHEWIELANRSGVPVDISGWSVLDEDGKLNLTIPRGTRILPGAFFLLARKGTMFPGMSVDAEFSGAIRNSDQTLRLLNADCGVEDAIAADPSWSAGENDTKQTMERNLTMLMWHTSRVEGGTPRRENTVVADATPRTSTNRMAISTSSSLAPAVALIENVAFCPADATGIPTRSVLINEVAWAGTANDKTSHEWFELKNPGGTAVALAGWQAVNKSGNLRTVFPEGSVLSANGFYLLERTDDETVPTIPADFIYMGGLKNSDEILRLFDSTCRLVDVVSADGGSGKTWPAGNASPDYRTMERGTDFSWHTHVGSGTSGIMGTPRRENSFVATSTVVASTTGKMFSVSVSKTGTGSGKIISGPTGIECGAVCGARFAEGTLVEFSAISDLDSKFMGWGGCVGNGTCSIQLSGDFQLIGEFTKVSPILPIVPPPPAGTAPTHLVISAVQVAGATANDEFVKIVNPTNTAVSLAEWSLQYRGSGAASFSKKNFVSTHTIAPGGTFLVAYTSSSLVASADMTHSSFAMSGTGGTVFLVGTTTLLASGNESTIVDKIAYGSGTYLFPEGAEFATAPAANAILQRKIMEGIIQDTDNNANDFEIQ
ncbi:MAG: lamin tail domain-containing protein [Patescibacteria group bacterium]